MMMKHNRRVVVTGMGVVSSIGIGWKAFWQSLLAGRSGITPISGFDTSGYDRKVAGEVKDFRAEDFLGKAQVRTFGRSSQMALASTQLALDDARLTDHDVKKISGAGVCIGTTVGESQIMDVYVLDYWKTGAGSVVQYPASNIAAIIGLTYQLKGYQGMFANACASSNFATAYGFDLVRQGRSDLMIVGGVDSLSQSIYAGFHRLMVIAPEMCQPFDRDRQGMIPAEGAGILILEEREHALRRRATIYAEMISHGLSSDAFHMTQPHVRGGVAAISKALENAGIEPSQVNYISAHGTGTRENDQSECAVFHEVFGPGIRRIPVSSIKSMLGHTLGAAAVTESIASVLAIAEGKIPPTINYSTPDPECDIDCVPNTWRPQRVDIAVNNSLAFGGNNATVVFKRFE